MSGLRGAVAPVWQQLREDVRADPVLRYVLVLAALLGLVGIWFRLPNFGGPDEYSRLLQPMEVAGRVAADPSFGALRRGILDGRALGATFYLYGLALAPLFLLVVLTGQFGTFTALGGLESRWALWHATPAWFWTGAVLLGRLVVLALVVGSVYLVYRLGTELGGRSAGRVAAAATAVTFALVDAGHVVNEDVPALFLLLATLLLAVRYVETGADREFLLGCLAAGLAVAFKLTAGIAVVGLGVAYLLRARRAVDPVAALVRPRLLGAGLVVGVVTISVGIPSVLVGGPGQLVQRITHTTGQKTTPTPGSWGIEFWLLRGYLRGLGLPLALAVVAGVAATLRRAVSRRGTVDDRLVVALVPAAVMLAVFATWQYVRVHHLLPTMPLLLLPFGLAAGRVLDGGAEGERRTDVARIAVVLVLLAATVYAGAGALAFANDPRDRATAQLATDLGPGEGVEVYENSVADVAAVHGRSLSRYEFPEENATYSDSLVLNETAYTEWMLATPDRSPAYVQLTATELHYLDPARPEYHQYPERRAHIQRLLDGEYEYTVVARYGREGPRGTGWQQLLRAGVQPVPEHTGERVVLLRRT